MVVGPSAHYMTGTRMKTISKRYYLTYPRPLNPGGSAGHTRGHTLALSPVAELFVTDPIWSVVLIV
jgi:hypothetical protein